MPTVFPQFLCGCRCLHTPKCMLAFTRNRCLYRRNLQVLSSNQTVTWEVTGRGLLQCTNYKEQSAAGFELTLDESTTYLLVSLHALPTRNSINSKGTNSNRNSKCGLYLLAELYKDMRNCSLIALIFSTC